MREIRRGLSRFVKAFSCAGTVLSLSAAYLTAAFKASCARGRHSFFGRLEQPVSFAQPRALQPPPFAECRKINSRQSIPSLRSIAGTELQSDFLVAIGIRSGVLLRFAGAGTVDAASALTVRFRDLFGGAALGAADPTGLLEVLRLTLRRFLPRFVSIHADIVTKLVLASSGMMRPFPCASFLAYNNCAALTGLGSRCPKVDCRTYRVRSFLAGHWQPG